MTKPTYQQAQLHALLFQGPGLPAAPPSPKAPKCAETSAGASPTGQYGNQLLKGRC